MSVEARTLLDPSLTFNAEGSPYSGQVLCVPVANRAVFVSEVFEPFIDISDAQPSRLGVFAVHGAMQVQPEPLSGVKLEFQSK